MATEEVVVAVETVPAPTEPEAAEAPAPANVKKEAKPKEAAAAAPKKRKASTRPSYIEQMITEAIVTLKEKNGSSQLPSNFKSIAMGLIRQDHPKTFLLSYDKISSNLDRILFVPPAPYTQPFPEANNVPREIKQWVTANIVDGPQRAYRPISLILEGPTRTGKTCWARSLGRHNYYMGYMDMAHHDDDAWYNVIDSIEPKDLLDMKRFKQLIGAMRDFETKIKYSKPRRIKGGIPSIVLCNPHNSYKDFLDQKKFAELKDWTSHSAQFSFITEPLFSNVSSQNQASASEI